MALARPIDNSMEEGCLMIRMSFPTPRSRLIYRSAILQSALRIVSRANAAQTAP
jgi:hypothetical protein